MKKKDFTETLKEFKLENIGAACYEDPVTGKRFCANGLSHDQALIFADRHQLTLINWTAGVSCTQRQC